MKGVSPKGKYGGIRLYQTSGAGSVSKKGFGRFSSCRVSALVHEMMLPRAGSVGRARDGVRRALPLRGDDDGEREE